jgi:hypothetical protein
MDEEYNDNVEESVNFQLSASEWARNEADKLLKQYRACKTEHARNRLRPKLEYMRSKLAFESRALGKLLGYEDYGNNETI